MDTGAVPEVRFHGWGVRGLFGVPYFERRPCSTYPVSLCNQSGCNAFLANLDWKWAKLVDVLLVWFLAGNEGMAPMNHPLWFPLKESLGSFSPAWVLRD